MVKEQSIKNEHFTALEFEGHSSIDMNGHCVDNGQPELFVKLGEGIQLLHLKHKCSNGFCLGFPVNLCGAELLKLCLCFLYRSINLLCRAMYSSWF